MLEDGIMSRIISAGVLNRLVAFLRVCWCSTAFRGVQARLNQQLVVDQVNLQKEQFYKQFGEVVLDHKKTAH